MIAETTIYAAAFPIVATVISISTLVFNLIERRGESRQTRLFNAILIDIAVSSVASFTEAFAHPYLMSLENLQRHLAQMICRGTRFLYFLSHNLLAALFYFYVLSVIGGFIWGVGRRHFWTVLPVMATEVLVCVNPFTDLVWYYDEHWIFHRGRFEALIYLNAAFYLVMALVSVFLYWRAVDRGRRLALAYAFSLTVIGVYIQFRSINLPVELTFEALSLVGVMMTVEKEDDRVDAETNVYNRTALRTDLENYFRMGRTFSVVCLRVTNAEILQRITGSLQQGELMVPIAAFLKNIHARRDIYRTATSSFVLISQDRSEEEQWNLAEALRQRFELPWSLKDMEIHLSAVVLFARTPMDIRSPEDVFLLSDGNIAGLSPQKVYAGRDLFFLRRDVEVERAIQKGLEEHNFDIYYQPIYDMKSGSLCAAEATLRLTDRSLGTIFPREFLAVARRNDTIYRIGLFLLEEVCVFLRSGIPTQMRLEWLCFGVLSIQCLHPDFLADVQALVKKYQVSPALIRLEIQEYALTEDYAQLEQVIRSLKEMGFGIALDRYGSGDSNLQSLFSMDFDTINVDMEVHTRGGEIRIEQSILENSIRIIKGTHRKALVKGVSTQEQMDMLSSLQIDLIQGPFYSKILGQNELISLLRVTEMAWREEQRARAQSEAKSNFLANMSHEIRTPINAILGMNEMILRESKDEAILSYAGDIARAGNSLLSLISDILDFSKIESGSMEIVEAEYGLSSVLNDVVNMIQVKMDQKGLKFILDVDEDLPEKLFGDEVRFRQIIVNILNNAVKYTPKGSVTLTVDGAAIGGDAVELHLAVKDTGFGIKEEDIGKLFGTFQRVDMEHTKTIEGSGLGLAITYNLLKMMGGDVKVESVYGEGSTFTVTLPQLVVDHKPIGNLRERYLLDQKNRPDYHEAFTAPTCRILVVDDTQVNLTVIKGLLKQTRLTVDTALSGKECLEMIKEAHYDVIFLDYRMPEMDGLETFRRMRSNANHPNADTPVIVLTANVVSGAREKFLQEGFDDYLAKPIDSRKLESMLVQFLPKEKVFLSGEGDGDRDEGGDDGSGVLAGLSQIPELDTDIGIARCGSEEAYLEVAQIYFDTIPQKQADISDCLGKEDWENYTIHVHALKSSSRIIGDMALGDAAEKLEMAGDARDIATIQRDTPVVLSRLLILQQHLADVFAPGGSGAEEEEDDRPLAPEETLSDAWEALREFAEGMDFESAMYVFEELDEYRIPGEAGEKMKQIRAAAERLEWDQVLKILEGGSV